MLSIPSNQGNQFKGQLILVVSVIIRFEKTYFALALRMIITEISNLFLKFHHGNHT